MGCASSHAAWAVALTAFRALPHASQDAAAAAAAAIKAAALPTCGYDQMAD